MEGTAALRVHCGAAACGSMRERPRRCFLVESVPGGTRSPHTAGIAHGTCCRVPAASRLLASLPGAGVYGPCSLTTTNPH